MKRKNMIDGRKIGVAAVAAFALSFGAAGTATAAPYGSPPGGALTPARSTASVANDTLTITGTNANDQITVALANGDPNTLVVDFGRNGGPAQSFPRDTFSAISVSLQAGDDQFSEVGTTLPDEPLTVHSGFGNDTIVAGPGNDVISGGDGNDTVNGGAGDDVIIGGRGDDVVTGAVGHDSAFLGSGQDSFIWNPGDGSDFVDGDLGVDTLVFNGAPAAEVMSLSANDSQSLFLRQPGNVRMDMDGVELLNLTPLGGADSFAVNDLTGTDFRQANVNLGVGGTGDGAVDTVTVNGSERDDRVRVQAEPGGVDVDGLKPQTRITGSEPTDHLQVNGRDGNDRVSVDRNVSASIGVGVDLGSGQL